MPVLITLGTILGYARTAAANNSTGLTDANGIVFANEILMNMFARFLDRRDDLFVQESERSISSAEIAGGSTPGKFLWPTDMYLLKELIVNFTDPTNQNTWRPCSQVDVANLPSGVDFEYLRLNNPTSSPVHDNRGDYFELFPTPTVVLTNAMKIHYFIIPALFTATTDVVPYPFNLNPFVMANGIASKFLTPNDPETASAKMKIYDDGVEGIINDIDSGEQQTPQAKGLPLTGAEF